MRAAGEPDAEDLRNRLNWLKNTDTRGIQTELDISLKMIPAKI